MGGCFEIYTQDATILSMGIYLMNL